MSTFQIFNLQFIALASHKLLRDFCKTPFYDNIMVYLDANDEIRFLLKLYYV